MSKNKVVVKGIPSKELQKKQATEEKTRVEEQVKTLGKEGLAAKAKELQQAMEENEKEAPDSIFDNFAVPGIKSINFHNVQTVNSDSKDAVLQGQDLSRAKMHTQLTQAKTNFAYVKAFMDTSDLPDVR